MKNQNLILSSLIILGLFFNHLPSFGSEIKEIYSEDKKLEIIDGDTIKIDNLKIRLHGIDAPEKDQICWDRQNDAYNCGLSSKEYLKKVIAKNKIVCVYSSLDVYKRILGTCYVFHRYTDGKDTITNLNHFMVSSGHAVAFKKYSTKYFKAEKFARRSGLGIWQGKFERPYEWRKKNK